MRSTRKLTSALGSSICSSGYPGLLHPSELRNTRRGPRFALGWDRTRPWRFTLEVLAKIAKFFHTPPLTPTIQKPYDLRVTPPLKQFIFKTLLVSLLLSRLCCGGPDLNPMGFRLCLKKPGGGGRGNYLCSTWNKKRKCGDGSEGSRSFWWDAQNRADFEAAVEHVRSGSIHRSSGTEARAHQDDAEVVRCRHA